MRWVGRHGGGTYLHEPAHDAVAKEKLVAAQGHRGDDGVVWSLPSLVRW